MFSQSSKLKTVPERNRNMISVMKEVNIELAQIHKRLERQIDVNHYKHATNYVNQYVSYTSIWNMKFNYNIESPEVALLQCLHLYYILNNEHEETLQQERQTVDSMYKLFSKYKPFSDEQIIIRKQQMLRHIDEQKNK